MLAFQSTTISREADVSVSFVPFWTPSPAASIEGMQLQMMPLLLEHIVRKPNALQVAATEAKLGRRTTMLELW